MTLGENIRRKRLEYDLEQQELAGRLNVNKSFICRIEKGQQIPSVKMLNKIADILHCSIDELLGRKAS